MSFIPPRFEVDSLDDLLGHSSAAHSGSWSAAISGRDGSGKSILAMHLASAYMLGVARPGNVGLGRQPSHVIYVSTDLSFEQAQNAWNAFGLHRPAARKTALSKAYGKNALDFDDAQTALAPELELVAPHLSESPTSNERLKDMFSTVPTPQKPARIFFVDLQKESAGDDWAFVNRLLGLLPTDSIVAPHLVIVDAVEGMEILVGRRDAYGEPRSRRSRVAQLIRAAKRSDRANLAFVIEEARPHRRLPEQFVTDLVIRLRQRKRHGYVTRTIEIEKHRGTSHARGEHRLTFRHGKGASTGRQNHYDEHPVSIADGDNVSPLAHLHIVPSLHVWNARIRERRERLPYSGTKAPWFDIAALDTLLGGQSKETEIPEPHLPGITFLLGDPGTFKSRLARRYLASGLLRSDSKKFARDGTEEFDRDEEYVPEDRSFFGREYEGPTGVAVLFNTDISDPEDVNRKLYAHALDTCIRHHIATKIPTNKTLTEFILHRRLGTSYQSSENFLAMLQAYINRARGVLIPHLSPQTTQDFRKYLPGTAHRELTAGDFDLSASQSNLTNMALDIRSQLSRRIRIVIDDLNAFFASHPNVRDDPMFLPSLVTLLKVEQVNALIVATGPGRQILGDDNLDPSLAQLRRLDERKLITWSIPFYGRSCSAITELVSTRRAEGGIYELRRRGAVSEEDKKRHSHADEREQKARMKAFEEMKDELLDVDKHFALYSGLDTGHPRPIPLMVRLFTGFHQSASPEANASLYPNTVKEALEQVFPGASTQGSSVVNFEPINQYERYFSFADLLDDTRLDQTLILQIDEFWTPHGNEQFLDLSNYWRREFKKADAAGTTSGSEDPYDVYEPHNDKRQFSEEAKLPSWLEITSRNSYPTTDNTNVSRANFFLDEPNNENQSLRSIPYLWDFGFLLARRDLWHRYRKQVIPGVGIQHSVTVGQIWNRLLLQDHSTSKLLGSFEDCEDNNPTSAMKPVEWMDFFDACRLISEQTSVAAFHVDTKTSESFLSLFLEVWFSIIVSLPATTDGGAPRTPLRQQLSSGNLSLLELVEQHSYSFFLAANEILGVFRHCTARSRIIEASVTPGESVAERHWYSTASVALAQAKAPYFVLRLPGHFCTRGDWRLAVAAGSRSTLLAEHALDILNNRRMQLLRLHSGVGLPTRDIVADVQMGNLITALRLPENTNVKHHQITYSQLCSAAPDESAQNPLQVFKRSWLRGYDRDSFFLRRFLAKLVEERIDWQSPRLSDRKSRQRMMMEDVTDPEKLMTMLTSPDVDPPFNEYVNFLKKLELLKVAMLRKK